MPRPLIQLGVGQLDELFAKSKADPKVLKQLEHELHHRQVPKAVALLAEVKAAMYGAPAATQVMAPVPFPTIVRPPTPPVLQPELRDCLPAVPVPTPPVGAQPRPTRPPVRPQEPSAAQSPDAPQAPTFPVDEAYKVLKATRGSTWESIERTRRQLVQQAHPSRVALLSAEKRAQAQAEAKRVNAAYAVLQATRAGHD